MKVKIKLITPDVAKELLKKNPLNRKIKNTLMYDLSRMMKCGDWVENGESIIIDSNGELKDGQHRLRASVLANYSFNVVFVTGVEPNVMPTIDTGANRGLSDVLFLNSFKNTAALASAIKWIYPYDNHGFHGNTIKLTNSSGLQYAEKNAEWLDIAYRESNIIYLKSSRLMSKSYLMYVFYVITSGLEIRDIHIEFVKNISGVIAHESTGASWVYKQLYNSRKAKTKLNNKYQIAIIIKAWNLFIGGDPVVNFIRFNLKSSLPTIRIGL